MCVRYSAVVVGCIKAFEAFGGVVCGLLVFSVCGRPMCERVVMYVCVGSGDVSNFVVSGV